MPNSKFLFQSPVDNQFAHSEFIAQRIALTAMLVFGIVVVSILGVHLYEVSDPYIKEVLSLKGDVVKGHAIFQYNCAGCHGMEADGRVGPSLKGVPKRKSKVNLIYQVISGKTPPMPKFQPSRQEMADLLEYLEEL